MTFGFHLCSKNLCKFFSVFLRSFSIARIRLIPLSCQILYHYSGSMIVSRFTSFTKNFEICCYKVAIFPLEARLRQCTFCKEPLLSWFSCTCRSFGPSGSECKYSACPMPLFHAGSEADSREDLAECVPMNWNTFIHKIVRRFF